MRGETGGEDTGSESGVWESVKGVNESFTPCNIGRLRLSESSCSEDCNACYRGLLT